MWGKGGAPRAVRALVHTPDSCRRAGGGTRPSAAGAWRARSSLTRLRHAAGQVRPSTCFGQLIDEFGRLRGERHQ